MKKEKKYTFDQKQLVFAFAGNSLLLLLVFILGVKIGKNLFTDAGLPSDQELLKNIKQKKISLTFPETLPENGKHIDEVIPPKNLPVIPSPPPPMRKGIKVQTGKSVAPSVAGRKKTNKKIVNKTVYSVQLGSFRRRKDAKRMAEKYKRLGFSTYIVSVTLKNKSLRHRVRSGRYEKKNEGYKAMKMFIDKFGLKPIVVSSRL